MFSKSALPPFMQMLDFEKMEMGAGSVSATMPVRDNFRQSDGSGIAPAWLTFALDTLLGTAVFSKIMKPVPIATVDLSTDFIGEMTPASKALLRTNCDAISGNTAFVSGSVHDSETGEQIVRTSAKFIIKGKPQKGEKSRKSQPEAPGFSLNGCTEDTAFESAKATHPYASWLKVKRLHLGGKQLTHLPFSEMIVGDPYARTIHGGMLASLMELAATGAIISEAATTDLLMPLSSSINFLKRTFTSDCFADAKIVRLGRNIIVVHTRAWQHSPEDPVAAATYLFKGLDTTS